MSLHKSPTSKLIAVSIFVFCTSFVLPPAVEEGTDGGPLNLRAAAYAAEPAQPGCEADKHNPGHYVSMRKPDETALIAELALPGVVGVQKRYYWKTLEPEQGQYDFSLVRADLEAAAQAGLQLVVFVEDKTFNGEVPTPAYLQDEHTAKNRNRGYTAVRWHPYVEERFIALLQALGTEFDCEPAFEGVAIQESSLSLEDSTLKQFAYSPEKYRDNLVTVLMVAADAMPSSNVFWYMNYLPKRQKYLAVIAEQLVDTGVIIGGPDVLPDNSSLARMTYPLYDDLVGQVVLFNSMQNDSYAHEREGAGDNKYWTLEEMFLFARDELHVDYLFWNRKNWRKPEDSFSFKDATPVIEKYADFRPAADSAADQH